MSLSPQVKEKLLEQALDALEGSWRVYAMIEEVIDIGLREDGRPLSFDHVQRLRVTSWGLTFRAYIAVEAVGCEQRLTGKNLLASIHESTCDVLAVCRVPFKRISEAAYEVEQLLHEVQHGLRDASDPDRRWLNTFSW